MPWCPKCKNEYVEGMTVCADCGSELVKSLEEAEQTETEEGAAPDFGYFEQADLEMEEEPDSNPDMEDAVRAGRTAPAEEGVYEDSAKKAEEFKSGAYTLLFVGVLGLVVLGVLISGVLPVRLNPSSQWMMCLVMGAMFLIFIVMGVLSLQSSKKLAKKAEEEGSLKKDMLAFCREKLTAEALDKQAQVLGEEPEEMRYFKRTEQLKSSLLEAFPDAPDGYLEYFADEVYPEIFGE